MRSKFRIAACLIAGAIGLLANAAGAQDGAKAIFYDRSGGTVMTSPPGQAGVAAKPPTNRQYTGLAYWIELVGSDGQSRRVTDNHLFRAGDRIKLHLQSNRKGFLYVFNLGSSGRTSTLFPNAATGPAGNGVEPNTPFAVPSNAFIRFDDNPGEEILLVMLSPQPMTELASTRDLVTVAQAKGAKDLLVEVDASSPLPATYKVMEGPDIALHIKLKHQ